MKKGIKIKELPISYSGRKAVEGKKITWKDGFHAIFTLLKSCQLYSLFSLFSFLFIINPPVKNFSFHILLYYRPLF